MLTFNQLTTLTRYESFSLSNFTSSHFRNTYPLNMVTYLLQKIVASKLSMITIAPLKSLIASGFGLEMQDNIREPAYNTCKVLMFLFIQFHE